jgi:hypothetical protein
LAENFAGVNSEAAAGRAFPFVQATGKTSAGAIGGLEVSNGVGFVKHPAVTLEGSGNWNRPKPCHDQIGAGVVVIQADDVRQARNAAIVGEYWGCQSEENGKRRGYAGHGAIF